jgi:hypothetical protein
MNDTPTPKTDRIMENILIAIDADNTGQSSQHREEARREIEQIERELAEARHHIEKYAAEARAAIEAHEDACLERLSWYSRHRAVCDQRDMLAEALRPFIDGWSDKSCDSIVTEQQFRDAKQALAAVKGGTP